MEEELRAQSELLQNERRQLDDEVTAKTAEARLEALEGMLCLDAKPVDGMCGLDLKRSRRRKDRI